MPFYVTVEGASKESKRIEDFIFNVLDHFFKPEPKRDIDIHVAFSRQLDANAFGYCWGDKKDISINIGRGGTWPHPETCEDVFCYYGFEAQIKTLSHELVHAKQYLRGEITGYDRIWRQGRKKIDCSHIKDEKEYPWEQEAYKLEDELYYKYW